jgi:hypothetical protein
MRISRCDYTIHEWTFLGESATGGPDHDGGAQHGDALFHAHHHVIFDPVENARRIAARGRRREEAGRREVDIAEGRDVHRWGAGG